MPSRLPGAANPIAFVAISRAEEAKRFYRDVVGLSFVADDDFALVFRSGDVTVRLAKTPAHTPPLYTVLGWPVADIRTAVAALKEKGVVFLIYENLPQDPDGVCVFPGGARVAWFKDPDGNVLSLTECA